MSGVHPLREMQRHQAKHLPRPATGFLGMYPVCFEGAPGGPFAGDTRWRGVKDFEHSTLCRVFNLDPNRFSFDLPSSVRGIGAMQQGYGGGASARRVSGFVFYGHPRDGVVVAKLTVCREGERFDDVDPDAQRDFEDLSKR